MLFILSLGEVGAWINIACQVANQLQGSALPTKTAPSSPPFFTAMNIFVYSLLFSIKINMRTILTIWESEYDDSNIMIIYLPFYVRINHQFSKISLQKVYSLQ